MEDAEIAVRCYVESEKKSKWISKSDGKQESTDIDEISNSISDEDSIDIDRILVFDTETTTDQYQNLTFGSYAVYEHGNLKGIGIFYGNSLPEKDKETLGNYCKEKGISLISQLDFMEKVFYPEVYDYHTLCIGFNLPFDLSRLAISFGEGRGRNKGSFSLVLSESKIFPRVIIKHIDNKISFISFGNGRSQRQGNNWHRKGNSNTFRGNFLDLKTLSFALTNESFSLESAGEHFKAEIRKMKTSEHGKVEPKYIDYNLNDVKATYSLFLKLEEEYEKYHLDKPMTKLYSPASLGKAYFDQMGIKSFSEKNPDFPKELLGYLMATYYGGRSEVRVRKTPMLVNLIDFLSMYPTMCILQELWRFVISDHIVYFNDTDKVKEFVDKASLETLQDPKAWKELTAIVQIVPDEDILPVRTKYGNKHTYNIGLNYLSSYDPIWYALADVIASKLLTGKAPKIIKAFRFVPEGLQDGLQSISIIGDRLVDPSKEDLFKALMEYRNEKKHERDKVDKASDNDEYERLNSLQNQIKTITNSTSYGIFVEINTSSKEGTKVKVYGNDNESFIDTKDKVEKFGKAFNPIIAIFDTSASRLVLAISEVILSLLCDNSEMNRLDNPKPRP